MGFSFGLAAAELLKKKKKKIERRAPNSKAIDFEEKLHLHEDVLIEILMKLPAKSLMRFKSVSKLWFSVISSRYFTNIFLKAERQRRLFTYIVNNHKNTSEFALLSSSANTDSVSILNQDIAIEGMGGYIVNPLRGLVCFRIQTRLRICNLTTKQLVELPMIRSRLLSENNDNVWNYFGHEHLHDEYKVLSIVWELSEEEEEDRVVRSEHQVLVLGPGASWRNIHSNIPPPPHRPFTQVIDINGVWYYGAWIDKNTSMVMSFDSCSEEFSLINLPLDMISSPNLMNYGGKVAVFEYSKLSLAANGRVELWVMEDGNISKWSKKKTIVLPVSQMNFLSYYPLAMQGSSGRSEVRLAKAKLVRHQTICYVLYDMEMKKITKRVQINSLCDWIGLTKSLLTILWDDIESIMYLET